MKHARIGLMALFLTTAPASGEVLTLDTASQARAGIVTRPVRERAFGESFRIVGQVVRTPGSKSTVKSILEGRVAVINVAPGDAVQEGQVLLELHSHALHGMQGEMMRAYEQLKLSESRVEAGRKLLELEGISRLELQQREQQALAARLDFELAKSELLDLGIDEEESLKILDGGSPDTHLPVRAPSDGVVLELYVQRHEWVQAFDSLVDLGNPLQMELQLQIPPDQASGVAMGDTVEFVPVGRPETAGNARVISRVPQVDPTTRTVTIRARIEGPKQELFPGVFVEGQLVQGGVRNSPSVPEAAVTRFGSTDYVFVRTGPETFEARPVRLGRFNGTRYEILEGVTLDEEVVVEGVFFLKSVLVKGTSEG
jgi:cobalt-zinc-cadmium efflux system membrane fusion protein